MKRKEVTTTNGPADVMCSLQPNQPSSLFKPGPHDTIIFMPPLRSIKLTVNFIKERKQVIAYAPALDMSTVGKSQKHAKQRFEELVRIFWNDISERHVVDEVLTELGWTKVSIQNKPQWVPPSVTSVDLQIPVAA